jgi:hypothetical protein
MKAEGARKSQYFLVREYGGKGYRKFYTPWERDAAHHRGKNYANETGETYLLVQVVEIIGPSRIRHKD